MRGERAGQAPRHDGEEGVERDGAPVAQADPASPSPALRIAATGSSSMVTPRAASAPRSGASRVTAPLVRKVVGPHSGIRLAWMGRQRAEGQDAEPPARDLVAVAVGAVQDPLAPALAQAGEVRQLVHDPGRQDQPRRRVRRAVRQRDREPGVGRGGGDRLTVEEGGGRVGGDLGAADGGDRARRAAVLPEETVRAVRETVAAPPGVDDQDALAGAHQGQGGGEAGVAAADDDGVVLHGEDLLLSGRKRRRGWIGGVARDEGRGPEDEPGAGGRVRGRGGRVRRPGPRRGGWRGLSGVAGGARRPRRKALERDPFMPSGAGSRRCYR